MDQLLNVEAVASACNVACLCRLYDSVEAHIRSLNSLGVKAEAYGSLLSSILMNKLPEEIRLLVSRRVSERDWNLTALLCVLQEELKARERVAVDKTSTGKGGRQDRQVPPTAAALLTGNGQGPITCCYCQKPHLSKECRIVSQPEARRQLLRKTGRCFICLRSGHISKECRSKLRCTKCNRRHHVSISLGDNPTTGDSGQATTTRAGRSTTGGTDRNSSGGAVGNAGGGSQNNGTQSNGSGLNANATPFPPKSTSLYVAANNTIFLQTALTAVQNPEDPTKCKRVRAVLDLGSQRSYISQRVVDALQLTPEGTTKMSIFTFGSNQRTLSCCKLMRVVLRTLNGSMEMHLLTTPTICEPLMAQPISHCAETYDHLSGLEFADISDGSTPMEVDLLIGSDYYWQLTTGRVIRGGDGPVAVETSLGWVLSGPAPITESCTLLTTHTLRVDTQEEESLDNTLKSFWELESLGVSGPSKSVQQEFEESIAFKDGRYEVCLPWKKPRPLLPDNYGNSLRRLQGLLRRLKQMPDILYEYHSVIQKQLELGVVEPVPHSDFGTLGEVHYLPHHPVIKRDRNTTKVRVVYDASSKARPGDLSLNDCLFTGPNYNQLIFDILLRFRSYPIAVTADIEKAFLMIAVSENDQDSLRFLWVRDINDPKPAVQAF